MSEVQEEWEEASPTSPTPSLDLLAHQVRQERIEHRNQNNRIDKELREVTKEVGLLSALVKNSEEARGSWAREHTVAINTLSATVNSVVTTLNGVVAAVNDLSELVGKLLAATAKGERQLSVHDVTIEEQGKLLKGFAKARKAVQAPALTVALLKTWEDPWVRAVAKRIYDAIF